MPLEHHQREGGGSYVTTTACPFCGDPIPPQNGLADHLPSCAEAPR